MADLPLAAMAPPFIAMGVGVSLAMPAVQSGVMRAVHHSDLGKASGAFSMGRFIGGAFGVAATASIFVSAGGFASPEMFTAGFRAVLWSMAVMTAAGAVAAATLPSGARQTARLAASTG